MRALVLPLLVVTLSAAGCGGDDSAKVPGTSSATVPDIASTTGPAPTVGPPPTVESACAAVDSLLTQFHNGSTLDDAQARAASRAVAAAASAAGDTKLAPSIEAQLAASATAGVTAVQAAAAWCASR